MKPLNPLKKKRMELCLSREDIAERIGVSTQTIGDYETCKRNPKIKDIIYVCKVGYLMEDNEIISGFIKQYYIDNQNLPNRIMVK